MKRGVCVRQRLLTMAWGILFFCLMLLPQSALAGAEPEFCLIAALVSTASYADDGGLLVRSWLKETDWEFYSRSTATHAADGRVHLARKTLADGRRVVMLAFPGTENKKDIEVDLRLASVPFGDAASAESAEGDGSGTADVPRVHKGFNDFVTAALFTETMPEFGDMTAGESLAEELKANPTEVLYLTGHSLGGAAALLTAARLADLGVAADQLQVITFGAPAVGNERFARVYEKKFHFTRIVMKNDPVAGILQSLSKRFVQFGEKVVWKPQTHEERFNHEMALYFDEALRRYYDAAEEKTAHELLGGTPQALSGGLYVAAPSFDLPETLAQDAPYIARAVHDALDIRYAPTVFSKAGAAEQQELFAAARAAGCKYVLVEHFSGKLLREKHGSFRLTLEEQIYDSDGRLLSLEERSTNTGGLPAIEAFLYLAYKGGATRSAALGLTE